VVGRWRKKISLTGRFATPPCNMPEVKIRNILIVLDTAKAMQSSSRFRMTS